MCEKRKQTFERFAIVSEERQCILGRPGLTMRVCEKADQSLTNGGKVNEMEKKLMGVDNKHNLSQKLFT